MKLSIAMDGFFLHMRAEGYSEDTIDNYRYALKNLATFLDDQEVEKITGKDLLRYFVYLRNDYILTDHSKGKPLAGSTLQNH